MKRDFAHLALAISGVVLCHLLVRWLLRWIEDCSTIGFAAAHVVFGAVFLAAVGLMIIGVQSAKKILGRFAVLGRR